MIPQRKLLAPLIIVFVAFNAGCLSAGSLLAKWGIDNSILIIANSLFFALAIITFFIQWKAMQNSNPNVFVRSVMAGMMIKMLVCVIAVIIYRFAMKDSFSEKSVIAAICIYFVYLVIEVRLLTKLTRRKNA